MSDYKGYWFHETKSGCGSGTGWRSGSSQNAVGAYCCHLSQIERKYVGSSKMLHVVVPFASATGERLEAHARLHFLILMH